MLLIGESVVYEWLCRPRAPYPLIGLVFSAVKIIPHDGAIYALGSKWFAPLRRWRANPTEHPRFSTQFGQDPEMKPGANLFI